MPTPIRPLDAFEKMQCLPGPGKDFITSLTIGYDGTLDEAKLSLALESLQQRSPLLQVSIQTVDNQLVYSREKVAGIRLDVVRAKTSDCWQQEVDTLIHSAFPLESGPLVKCRLVKHEGGGALIIAAHHVIMDGKSLVHAARDLFSLLWAKHNPQAKKNPQLQIPCLNQLVGAATPHNALRPTLWGSQADSMPQCNAQDNWPDRTGLLFRKVPHGLVSALRKKAKAHGIRLQSTFLSAMLRAMAKTLGQNSLGGGPRQMHYECPVCLRQYLGNGIQPSDLGSYIGLVQFQRDVCLFDDPWNFATEIHHALHARLDPHLPQQSLSAVKDLMSVHSNFDSLREAQDRKMPYIGVSNLGKIDFPKQPTKECDIRFIYPAGALHSAFYHKENAYAITHSWNDETFMTLVYPASHLSKRGANLLFDSLFDELAFLANAECIIQKQACSA